MHDNQVIHRDIKAENILIGEEVVYMTQEFIRSWNQRFVTLVGQFMLEGKYGVLYVALQSISLLRLQRGMDMIIVFAKMDVSNAQADIWCLGILAYELCTGETPYQGSSAEEVYSRITRTDIFFPDTSSSLFQDFINHVEMYGRNDEQLVVKEPERRYTIDQVLNHRWLQLGSLS